MTLNSKVKFDTGRNGRSAFASASLMEGEIIKVLMGEIVSTRQMWERVRLSLVRDGDALQFEEGLYLILDDESLCFNHSCSPNSAIGGYNRLFALKNIMEGEEITFDYSTVVGMSPNNSLWAMNCACGSDNCRGLIGPVQTLPVETMVRYAESGALPDFIYSQLETCGNPIWPASASVHPVNPKWNPTN